MTKNRSWSVRIFTLLMLLVVLIAQPSDIGLTASASEDSMYRTSLEEMKELLTDITYSDYLEKYNYIADAKDKISVDLKNIDTELTDVSYAFENAIFKDADGNVIPNVLVMGDDGNMTFNVNIPDDAFYSIEVEYYTGSVYLYKCSSCGFSVFHDNQGYSTCKSCEKMHCPTCEKKDGGCGSSIVLASASKNSDIERAILIDSIVPYKETRSVELARKWRDMYATKDGSVIYSDSQDFFDKTVGITPDRVFPQDTLGNEKKPQKVLVGEWAFDYIYDSTGYSATPLKYYFSKGEHDLTFKSLREPLVVKSITLKKAEQLPTYEEYLKAHEGKENNVNDGTSFKIQAEHSTFTSSKTIYQISNSSSVITEPWDASRICYNEIGGDKWQYVGQWVEWRVDIPETGFYSIVLRAKQDTYSGIYVSRNVSIDGVIPFAEANNLQFNYSSNFITKGLNDGETTFKFYLTKGVHSIRMEAVLGDMAYVLSNVENSLNIINGYYRKILMVTGSDPDEFRDYGFETSMPDVLKGFQTQSKLLYEISAELERIIGYKGDHSVILDKTAYILEQMGTRPTKVAGMLGDLKAQIGSLGTWITSTQSQPLDVDYILFQSPDKATPPNEGGFWESLWGEIRRFIMSFFSDYTTVGSFTEDENSQEEKKSLLVWTSSSRDTAQIIRDLVDNDFAEKYPGIEVDIKIVVGGSILPSILAGTGPDVTFAIDSGTVINYAIRYAVKAVNNPNADSDDPDLRKIGFNFTEKGIQKYKDDPVYSKFFDDVDSFEEVKKRFADAATIPLSMYGVTYAIPESMSFTMLFYRKDIFAELGIEVPKTWDELYDIIYTLDANKMDIGFPTGTGVSLTWMYQQGETLYNYGGKLADDGKTYYEHYMDEYGDWLSETNNTYEVIYAENERPDYEYKYVKDNGDGTYTYTYPKTDGMSINLDCDASLAAFKEACQLFTMYDFPVSYDFANRFRTGEMPLAWAGYDAYNQLIVFAPEINGLWEFTPMPGYLNKDGTITNTALGGVNGTTILRGCSDENAFAAWTFIQWWTSAKIQSDYGNELEALLGPSAKYGSANLEALYNMPWSRTEYDNLFAQFQDVTLTPEYPGGYIIGRYTGFAFLEVYNEDAEPVEALRNYMEDINREFDRKRKEFGLCTSEDFKDATFLD